VGSFFGAWAAGWLFDRTGSYDLAWAASIALALFAAIVHLPIRDAPVARLQPA
jgi:cyanate permease